MKKYQLPAFLQQDYASALSFALHNNEPNLLSPDAF